jgi:hypothetical protein
VRVIKIEHIAACGIEEGSAQRIDPFGSADDSRLPTYREHQERGESMLNRILSAAGQRGGDKVQDRAFAFVPQRVRELFPSCTADEAAECPCDV